MKTILFNKTVDDKYNGTKYIEDHTYTFEDARANEILASGYAEDVTPKPVEAEIETATVDKSKVETAVPKRRTRKKAEDK